MKNLGSKKKGGNVAIFSGNLVTLSCGYAYLHGRTCCSISVKRVQPKSEYYNIATDDTIRELIRYPVH